MLFTSLTFLLFLAAAIALDLALPQRLRWAGLLLASYVFYAWNGALNLVWLGAVTVVIFACGWGLGRASRHGARAALLAAGVVVLVGALAAAKFYDFLAGECERLGVALLGAAPMIQLPRLGVHAPAGFSFYVFSAVSYLADAYAGRVDPAKQGGALFLYVAYFPKILAGPIERATRFLPAVAGGLRMQAKAIAPGAQLIVWGLFKKAVIADNLAPMVDRAFSIAAFATPVELVLAVYFFAFQIYCDFSGYTDIAIGVSRLFGVELMENFRRPYLSRSTSEFWARRWHISLGTWFRDYVYIPLGGSRAGNVRLYANAMIVFVLSGLWHAGLGYGVGWTFLIWGALNGLYQWGGLASAPLWRRAGERLPGVRSSGLWALLRILFTFHLILLAWVFFRAKNLDQAWLVLRRIGTGVTQLPAAFARFPFSADHYLAGALIVLLLAVEILDERKSVWARLASAPVYVRWTAYYAVLFALPLLGRWQTREFIYMQF